MGESTLCSREGGREAGWAGDGMAIAAAMFVESSQLKKCSDRSIDGQWPNGRQGLQTMTLGPYGLVDNEIPQTGGPEEVKDREVR